MTLLVIDFGTANPIESFNLTILHVEITRPFILQIAEGIEYKVLILLIS